MNPIKSSEWASSITLAEADRVDASRTQTPHRLPPRLTIVIVNYNGWSDVLALLEKLEEEPEIHSGVCRAVVVDNGSSEPAPSSQALRHPGVDLVLRPDNGGFAVGVNAGWRKSRGDWLLLLNPDVDVEPGTLGQILRRIDALETRGEGPPGIVGFGLRNPDGTPQGSVGRFPSFARFVGEQFRPRRGRKYVSPRSVRPGPVDWTTGACMLLSARMMADAGGLDEDFFLYHEEVALCRVARERGWRVEYDPSVQVVHRHPLQDRPISPKMRVVIRHGKLLYFLKHAPRRQFLALARVVEAEAAFKGAWAALRRKPAERRAWRTIGRMAAAMRRGRGPRGREALALAEEAESEPSSEESGPIRSAAARRRSVRPRGSNRHPAGAGRGKLPRMEREQAPALQMGVRSSSPE